MNITKKLIYGISFKGTTYYDFTIKPLTLGGELKAMEALEAMQTPAKGAPKKPINAARQSILETLAYWTQQLDVPGIPEKELTIDFLLDNLASDDYATILASLDELREKSLAAGQKVNEEAQAASEKGQATN